MTPCSKIWKILQVKLNRLLTIVNSNNIFLVNPATPDTLISVDARWGIFGICSIVYLRFIVWKNITVFFSFSKIFRLRREKDQISGLAFKKAKDSSRVKLKKLLFISVLREWQCFNFVVKLEARWYQNNLNKFVVTSISPIILPFHGRWF